MCFQIFYKTIKGSVMRRRALGLACGIPWKESSWCKTVIVKDTAISLASMVASRWLSVWDIWWKHDDGVAFIVGFASTVDEFGVDVKLVREWFLLVVVLIIAFITIILASLTSVTDVRKDALLLLLVS